MANLNYMGSITLNSRYRKLGLKDGMLALIRNLSRHVENEVYTYIIYDDLFDRTAVCLNGAAAHLIHVGDEIIVMGFEMTEAPITPRNILVDAQNRFTKYL